MASLTRFIQLASESESTQSDCCVVESLVMNVPRKSKAVNMQIQDNVKTAIDETVKTVFWKVRFTASCK